MKRYEEIGNFWNERGAGRAQADTEKREELLTLKEARRQGLGRENQLYARRPKKLLDSHRAMDRAMGLLVA